MTETTRSLSDPKTVLVTGATSGLGAAACQHLLENGHRVVVGVRRPDAARAFIGRWDAADRAEVLEMDLASLGSVHNAADRAGRIDAILCNAGVQVPAGLKRTKDGHELSFGVNHLAHFALVTRLADRLPSGGRVVFVSSSTHDPSDRVAGFFGFRGGVYTSAAELASGTPAPDAKGRQVGMDRYATSKLCNIVTMYALAQRSDADRLGVFCVDPGLVPATGLAREHPAPVRFLYGMLTPLLERFPFASTPTKSGAVMARVATDPGLDGETAVQFNHRDERAEPWSRARDQEVIDDLWSWSERAVRR